MDLALVSAPTMDGVAIVQHLYVVYEVNLLVVFAQAA